MKKILSIDIIDIIPYVRGILFVRKENLEDDNIKVTFFCYDTEEDCIKAVPKSVYLLNKFGSSYESIAKQLGDYVSCDAGILPGNSSFVIFPSGEVGVFSPEGVLKWTGDLIYHEASASGIAVENSHIWCAVPGRNCVIRYSVAAGKVVMRIGSENSGTFAHPETVTQHDGKLYVCSRDSMKISTVNLRDYSVADYLCFAEPVHKYLTGGGKEFVVLDSGVYML